MYSKVLRNLLFPVMELYSGTNIQQNLAWLNKTQWWSRKELEELQNKQVRALINHAYHNVPYYHRIFKEREIYPEDIKKKEDLVKLPFLTKDIIRKNTSEMLATNMKPAKFMSRHSSGSTGEPLKFYIDKATYSQGWAQTFRCWGWAGYSIGDSYVKITHPRKTVKQKIQDRLMNCTIVPAFDINDQNFEGVIGKINAAQPVLIRGFPSSIYLLAKFLEKYNAKLNVSAVMTTGDMLFPHFRELIEAKLNCEVFDAYGGEGTAVCYECKEHQGYHIAQESVAVEFIREDENISYGESGDIVLTNLTNYAMPLIRYKINDIGRPSEEICPCGRGLMLMDSIEGRSTDVIKIPDGRFLTIHFFSTYLKHVEGIEQYQIIQEKLDKIIIKIVKNDRFTQNDLDYVTKETNRRLGDNIDVQIDFVDTIPLLKSGKRRFVLSKL